MRGSVEAGGKHDSGRKSDQRDEVPPVQWQCDDLSVPPRQNLPFLALACSRGASAVTFTDSVTLPIIMERSRDIWSPPSRQRLHDATQRIRSSLRLSSRSRAAGPEEMITAIVTRSRRLLQLRVGIDQSNLRTRNGQTGWIADIPGQLDFRRLCVECRTTTQSDKERKLRITVASWFCRVITTMS